MVILLCFITSVVSLCTHIDITDVTGMMYQYSVVAVGVCDGQPAIWFSQNQGLNFTQYDGFDSSFNFMPNSVLLTDNDYGFLATGAAGFNNVVPYAFAVLGDGTSCSSAGQYNCTLNYNTCTRAASGNATLLCQCMADQIACYGSCIAHFVSFSQCMLYYSNYCDCGASRLGTLKTVAVSVPNATHISALNLAVTLHQEYIMGTDQNVLHTKTPEVASSWITTVPMNGDRTFTGFAEVKGGMIGVGASTTGPIAVSKPSNPYVWTPTSNEPSSDISLRAIASNYTVGAIASGVQIAVGSITKNMISYGVILMSLDNGKSFDVVYTDTDDYSAFYAVYTVAYCYATGGRRWIAAGTSIVVSADGFTWMPAKTTPVPLDANHFATTLAGSYYYGGRYPVLIGGTDGLMASSLDCGDTWTMSSIA